MEDGRRQPSCRRTGLSDFGWRDPGDRERLGIRPCGGSILAGLDDEAFLRQAGHFSPTSCRALLSEKAFDGIGDDLAGIGQLVLLS